MPDTEQDIMEQASSALRRMDYLACEAMCQQALVGARTAGNWADYARILLPLQEARRQRRVRAADGLIRLGTTDLAGTPTDWLNQLHDGCIALTHPHSLQYAAKLACLVHECHRYVELLYVDNEAGAATWILRAVSGPAVSCPIPPPPAKWQNQWITDKAADFGVASTATVHPGAWFLRATEALGNAAFSQVKDALGTAERIEALEQMLNVVADHEVLLQQLGSAARAMRDPDGQA